MLCSCLQGGVHPAKIGRLSQSGAALAGRYVLAIAFAIGVVVDVRIDFAGAGRMLFGGLALALCPFRLFLCGELGLLRAPGSGLGLLAQSSSLLAPLLQPAPASDSEDEGKQ